MVTPERLEELKREFEQAVAMAEQVKEWWEANHQQDSSADAPPEQSAPNGAGGLPSEQLENLVESILEAERAGRRQ